MMTARRSITKPSCHHSWVMTPGLPSWWTLTSSCPRTSSTASTKIPPSLITAPMSRVILRLVMMRPPSLLRPKNEKHFVISVSPLVCAREKLVDVILRRKTMVVVSCYLRINSQYVYICFKQVLAYPLLWFLCLTFHESEDSLSEPCA